jgi:hypothetical protein
LSPCSVKSSLWSLYLWWVQHSPREDGYWNETVLIAQGARERTWRR